jgi:Domain of unknown function (DUF4406)
MPSKIDCRFDFFPIPEIDELVNKTEKEKLLYLSGPISSDPDYEQKFAASEKLYSDKGYVVINPVKIGKLYRKVRIELGLGEPMPGDYLLIDLYYLRFCGTIAMMDNWEVSEGAIQENLYSQYYNIETINEYQEVIFEPNQMN